MVLARERHLEALRIAEGKVGAGGTANWRDRTLRRGAEARSQTRCRASRENSARVTCWGDILQVLYREIALGRRMGEVDLLFLLLAALFAGFIDAVAGGGGLIQVPTLLVTPPRRSCWQRFSVPTSWRASLARETRRSVMPSRLPCLGVWPCLLPAPLLCFPLAGRLPSPGCQETWSRAAGIGFARVGAVVHRGAAEVRCSGRPASGLVEGVAIGTGGWRAPWLLTTASSGLAPAVQ